MRTLLALAFVALCAGTVTAQDAGVEDPAVEEPKKKKKKKRKKNKGGELKTEDTVAGGTHWRIDNDKGAIHVWVPPGYDRDTAGTVVYVHGYHVDVDEAWEQYDLAEQFKASKQNAIFIVPEAPSGRDEPVFWPALADLRKAVRKANIRLPGGPIVLIGHSGAYRTLSEWVDHKHVAQVILLDALYGRAAAFDDFIGTGKRADQHRMILIGEDTDAEAKAFLKKYPSAVVRDDMPEELSGFSRKEKKAKLLYIKSQYGHMEIVTSKKVIPILLRLTPLASL